MNKNKSLIISILIIFSFFSPALGNDLNFFTPYTSPLSPDSFNWIQPRQQTTNYISFKQDLPFYKDWNIKQQEDTSYNFLQNYSGTSPLDDYNSNFMWASPTNAYGPINNSNFKVDWAPGYFKDSPYYQQEHLPQITNPSIPDLINQKLNTNMSTTTGFIEYGAMDLNMLKEESDVIIRGTVMESLPSYQAKSVCIYDQGDKEGYDKEALVKEAYEKGYDNVFIMADMVGEYHEIITECKRGNDLIFTDKVIHVSKYYKNNLGLSEIVIREMGGTINREEWGTINTMSLSVAGETPLSSGDEVILFLKRFNLDKYIIIGGSQGKYYVRGNNAVNEMPQNTMNLDELEAEILL